MFLTTDFFFFSFTSKWERPSPKRMMQCVADPSDSHTIFSPMSLVAAKNLSSWCCARGTPATDVPLSYCLSDMGNVQIDQSWTWCTYDDLIGCALFEAWILKLGQFLTVDGKHLAYCSGGVVASIDHVVWLLWSSLLLGSLCSKQRTRTNDY